MSDAPATELRQEIATRHGLGAEAASLIAGETIGELEASASRLAKLVDAHTDRRAPVAEPDPISAALAGKAARKRELLATITGRHPQPRDERGRFASGFDGGARQSLPPPRDPERDHDELVADVARVRRIFGGGDF